MNPTFLTLLIAVTLIAIVIALIFPRISHRVRRKFQLLPLLFSGYPRTNAVEFANIGDGNLESGIKSYLPNAAEASGATRYLLYKIGSDGDHATICGAGDTPLGPTDDQVDTNNLEVPFAIKLLGAVKGTVRVITDGTVNNGDHVKCGASGQVTQAASTNRTFGTAIIPSDCSKAAGDVISIIPYAPQLYVF